MWWQKSNSNSNKVCGKSDLDLALSLSESVDRNEEWWWMVEWLEMLELTSAMLALLVLMLLLRLEHMLGDVDTETKLN